MAQQKWRAVIMTQSNRLEVVEFESPNNNRQDAVAQCMAMFAAKEIKTINPAPTYGSSSSRYRDDDDDGGSDSGASWEAILFLIGIVLLISFWPYFLLAGASYGIYRIIKYIRST